MPLLNRPKKIKIKIVILIILGRVLAILTNDGDPGVLAEMVSNLQAVDDKVLNKSEWTGDDTDAWNKAEAVANAYLGGTCPNSTAESTLASELSAAVAEL